MRAKVPRSERSPLSLTNPSAESRKNILCSNSDALMPPAPIPSKPWTDLGCPPEDLVLVVGSVVRGEYDRLEAWVRGNRHTAQVIEMLCARHRAGPFLAWKLRNTAVWDALPEAARQRLNKSAELQSSATADCLEHLDGLAEILGRHGCDYLLLKGPELGLRFSGAADARGYRDLDILVRATDRSKACAAFEAAGYWRLSRWLLGGAVSARFNHAVDYRMGTRLLDLHWCVSRAPGVHIPTEDLFQRSLTIDLVGRRQRVLSPADELTLLLTSTFADIQRGYLRLQSFVDIAQVVAQMPPGSWDGFFEQQASHGTQEMNRAVLGLVASLFQCQPAWPGLTVHLSPIPSAEESLAVLLPSPGGRTAKRWALPYLPVNRLHYALWWGLSLPFRVAASHPLFRRSKR
jgi:hypothetical protein